MGLDMYLSRHVYVGANYEHNHVEGVIALFRNVTPQAIVDGKVEPIKIDLKKVNVIVERVGYWRKANQIHNWFVQNVMDGEDECRDHYVDPDKLAELLDLCKQVQAHPEQAAELLPTQSGFFFGSTDYDEYYFQDIQDTIDILTPLVENPDNLSQDFYYYPSW